MIEPPRHLIRTQGVQIRVARPIAAAAIMDAAGEICRARLEADTDEVFSRLCGPEETVRLPRLEVDLGTIAETEFVTEFPVRFRARLAEEVQRALRHWRAEVAIGASPASARRSVSELLEHLLLHGTLPWWAAEAEAIDPAQALTEELTRETRAVAILVRRLGRLARVRFRLVQWLADPALEKLVRAVAPAEADFVVRYAADLEERHREKPLVRAGAAEFRQAKWEIILAHLLADRGSRFNEKMFLQQTLRELAGRFSVGYGKLLGDLVRVAAGATITWRASTLPVLLTELLRDELQRSGSDDETFAESVGGAPNAGASRAERLWATAWRSGEAGAWRVRRGELAYWRDLSPAEARAVTARLVRQHGARGLATWLAELFAGEEWDEVRELVGATAARETSGRPAQVSALAHALAGLPAEPREFATADGAAPEEADELALPALRVLLATGRLPSVSWAHRWYHRREDWLALMLARHAEAAAPLVRAWARQENLAPAWAGYFSDTGLASLVEVVEPHAADEVLEITLAVVAAPPTDEGLAPSPVAWRSTVWTVVFGYLLTEHGSVFNTRSFLAASVRQWAARCQVEADVMWSSLAAAAARAGQTRLVADLAAIGPLIRGTEHEELGAADLATKNAHSAMEPALAQALTAAALRRSAVWRLRLWQWLLEDAPIVHEAWVQALLPILWQHWDNASAATEPWRELLRLAPAGRPDAAAEGARLIDQALQTGGESFLCGLFFAGEQVAAARWREAMTWLEQSPELAAFFPGGRGDLRARLWRGLAALWREEGGRPVRDLADFLARVLWRLGVRATVGGGAATQASEVWVALQAVAARETGRVPAGLQRTLLGGQERIVPVETLRAPVREEPDDLPSAVFDMEPAAKPDVEAEAVDETAADREAPIAVTNAGLVLLGALLPELFKRCGWLDGPLFRDYQATQQAVHLLQYLVDGGRRTHEYSLVLNKILCGLDPAVGVIATVEFTDAERTAAGQLLAHVSAHWPRGAAISVEGLRSSYLHRPGWLRRTITGGWSLRVERRGWDVLLTELDWSIPGPRPGWMPQPLEVEWL